MAADQPVCRVFHNLESKEIFHLFPLRFLRERVSGEEDESSLYLLKNEQLTLQLNIKHIKCRDRVLYFSCIRHQLILI